MKTFEEIIKETQELLVKEKEEDSLKPCPFCGCKASLILCYNDEEWIVRCCYCETESPEYRTDKTEAINHWNTRYNEKEN